MLARPAGGREEERDVDLGREHGIATQLGARAEALMEHGPALVAWLCVAGLLIVCGITIDGFYSLEAIRTVLVLASLLGIAAAGQTIVVVLGGIDLAIPALMVLTSVGIPQLISTGWGWPEAVAVIGVLCVTIGAVTGFLCRLLRVHPLIVTLGTNFMISGVLLAWTQGHPNGVAPGFLSAAVSASNSMGPIPLPPICGIWLAVAVLMGLLCNRTAIGRRVYAYGSNPAAAEYCLVRPRLLWAQVFALSGFMAFIAGLMLSGYVGYGDLSSGDPYLLNTVAAVIVGGTSLLGGRGGYGRTIAGVLILTLAELVLVGNGVNATLQQVVLGGVIVGFVALYGRERRLQDRV
jgi:ribose transport system permease protein